MSYHLASPASSSCFGGWVLFLFLGFSCLLQPLKGQPADAQVVWTTEAVPERLAVSVFRRQIELSEKPEKALLNIFADSRYHLYVNGVYIQFGPIRFYPEHPRYDTHDLAPYLRSGPNEILVRVISNGTYSFQQRRSRPGFIAWGKIQSGRSTESLATPGKWEGKPLQGYDAQALHLTFALGPMEVYDARIDSASAWKAVIPCSGPLPWGGLEPRNIPFLTRDLHLPRRRIGHYPLEADEDRWYFRLKVPDASRAAFANGRLTYGQTYIYSPQAQKISVGIWWGEHYLNGEKCPQTDAGPGFPHRQTTVFDLKAGWNHFWVKRKTFWGKWDFMLAAPKAAGLRLSPGRQETGPDQFMHTGPVSDELAEWLDSLDPAFDLAAVKMPKIEVQTSTVAPNPAVHQSWQQWGEQLPTQKIPLADIQIAHPGGEVLVFDMGRKMLGQLIVEYEAPAGTIVDIGWSEDTLKGRPRLAKRVGIYPAARRISTGGVNRLETLKPYGLRFLQVQISEAKGPVRIRRVAVREQVYPLPQRGSFRCSNPRLNAIWELGWRTLRVCAEDSYTDTPFRERGLYAGDMLPQQGITLVGNGDMRLVRRSIELFLDMYRDLFYAGEERHPDEIGLLEDYPLLTLESLRWYADRSQDWSFVDSVLPAYVHLLEHELARRGPEGYVQNQQVFIEWTQIEKKEVANAAYHALLTRSCAQLSYLAQQRNQIRLSRRFSKLADQLQAVLHEQFWDAEAQAYCDGIKAGQAIDHHYPISSAWPLLFGLETAEQTAPIRQHLQKSLADIGSGNRERLATPYGGFYLLLALAKTELAGEAERFILQHWGPMIDRHDDTAWENFGDEGNGTLSHAWSGGPTYYLSSQLLGVELGYPHPHTQDTLLIAPLAETVDWAEGVIPLPAGPLQLRWEVAGDHLLVRYKAPTGLAVKIAPRGRLGELKLVIQAQVE